MSPPYRNGSIPSSRCSLAYSTPTPNGASILWNENARKSTSAARTSVNDPGTSCAPSTSRYDRRSPFGWEYPLALHVPPQPRQDLPAQPVPGDVVGVVLQQRGHHVVPVAELGQQRVHHRVNRLGRIPVQADTRPAGRADQPRNRVVVLLQQPGHRLRRAGLAPVHVLIPRPQRGVQLQQLPRRLRTRRVIRHNPAQLREHKMPTDSPDIQRVSTHRLAPGDITGHRGIPPASRRRVAAVSNTSLGAPP